MFTAPVRPILKLVHTIELFDDVGAPLDHSTALRLTAARDRGKGRLLHV